MNGDPMRETYSSNAGLDFLAQSNHAGVGRWTSGLAGLLENQSGFKIRIATTISLSRYDQGIRNLLTHFKAYDAE